MRTTSEAVGRGRDGARCASGATSGRATRKPSLCSLSGLGVEQEGAEDRDDRQRDDERRRHADDGGDRDGGEEPALHAGEAEQRQEDQDDQDGGVEDRGSDLAGGPGDHLELGQRGGERRRSPCSRRNTFSTSTMASSTTMPMATARPPRVIEFTLSPKRSNTRIVIAERERDGGQRDEGDAEVEQEEEQDERHHDGAVAERFLQVADGEVDEVGLAVEGDEFGALGEGMRAVPPWPSRPSPVRSMVSKPGDLRDAEDDARSVGPDCRGRRRRASGSTSQTTSATSLMRIGRSFSWLHHGVADLVEIGGHGRGCGP